MACASSLARAALSLACLLGATPGAVAASASTDRTTLAAVPSVVSVEMRARAKATQSQVRLGDIAFLTSADLVTLRRLMALPIGPAPRPGSAVVVDRETLVRWVQARSGLQSVQGEVGVRPTSLRWSGASETEIESEAQQLSGEIVVDAARASLMSWLTQRSVHAEVQALSPVRDLVLPVGAPVLRVRPLADQAQPARRMLVWVDAWVDERFVRTTAVSFEVGAWAPMTVATRNVDRGTAVDPVLLHDATESREVDVTTVRHATPLTGEREAQLEAGRQRLRRPLRAGEVLTEAHLEATPAVVRGQSAHLLARSGVVSVESRVEVLQDGREGQVVRVKVPGAGGEVLARVTGPGKVEVQP